MNSKIEYSKRECLPPFYTFQLLESLNAIYYPLQWNFGRISLLRNCQTSEDSRIPNFFHKSCVSVHLHQPSLADILPFRPVRRRLSSKNPSLLGCKDTKRPQENRENKNSNMIVCTVCIYSCTCYILIQKEGTTNMQWKRNRKTGSAMDVILNLGKQTFNLPHVSPLQPITLQMATSTKLVDSKISTVPWKCLTSIWQKRS